MAYYPGASPGRGHGSPSTSKLSLTPVSSLPPVLLDTVPQTRSRVPSGGANVPAAAPSGRSPLRPTSSQGSQHSDRVPHSATQQPKTGFGSPAMASSSPSSTSLQLLSPSNAGLVSGAARRESIELTRIGSSSSGKGQVQLGRTPSDARSNLSRSGSDAKQTKKRRRYGYSKVFGDISTFSLALSASALQGDRKRLAGSTEPTPTPVRQSRPVRSNLEAFSMMTLVRKPNRPAAEKGRKSSDAVQSILAMESGNALNDDGEDIDDASDEFTAGYDPNDMLGDEAEKGDARVRPWYWTVYRESLRMLVAAIPALLAFPASVVIIVVEVMQTLLWSIWYDPGKKNKQRAGLIKRVLAWLLWPFVLLMLILAALIVFYFGPRSLFSGSTVVVSAFIVIFLLGMMLPVLVFFGLTGHHHYWNRVPGGLYRATFRWTFANFRTLTALLFSSLQIASFPLSRLVQLTQDADLRLGGDPSSSDPTFNAYLTVIAQLNAASEFVVGLFPFVDSIFQLLLYICLSAVALWVILLTLPIAEQLLALWWVDWELMAQYNGKYLSSKTNGPEWTTEVRDGYSNQRKQSLTGKLNQFRMVSGPSASRKSSGSDALDVYVATDGRQIVLPAGSKFIFRVATGHLLGMRLYSRQIHGFVQYLLGDLFYVTITSILLRSFDCSLRCDDDGCTATLDSLPTMECWGSMPHQALAVSGLLAFIVYVYTATFATPLMSDVLDLRDTLDVRWTPRFGILDRLSQVTVLACYILISNAIPFVPIVVHALVSMGMVIFVERYKPASERTVLLRSSLYQINMCIAISALTAYIRVRWLPLALMGSSVGVVIIVSILRYIPLRFQLHAEDIERALTGLGPNETDFDADLLRVRGKEKHLLESAQDHMKHNRIDEAINHYKRAMYHISTMKEAGHQLAKLTFEGGVIPRRLASCILICRLMLEVSGNSASLSAKERRLFDSLLFLAQCDLGIRPTVPLDKMYFVLENMRRTRDRRLQDPYSLTALALLHERRALTGPMGPHEKGPIANLTTEQREQLAFMCLQLASTKPDGAIACLHLARYYVEGIGTAPNVFRAIDLLNRLAIRMRFPHVYTYLGLLNMYQARSMAKKQVLQQEARKWRDEAVNNWRRGAELGDPDCQKMLQTYCQLDKSGLSGFVAGSNGASGAQIERQSSNAAAAQSSVQALRGDRRLAAADPNFAPPPRLDRLAQIQAMAPSQAAWPPNGSFLAPEPAAAGRQPAPSAVAAAPSGALPAARAPALGYSYASPSDVADAVFLNRQNFLFRGSGASKTNGAPLSDSGAASEAGSPPAARLEVNGLPSHWMRSLVNLMRADGGAADSASISDDDTDLSTQDSDDESI